jgi:hypothetical protein
MEMIYSEDRILTISIIITSIVAGGRHSLAGGFLPVGIMAVRCENLPSSLRVLKQWTTAFTITAVAFAITPYFFGFYFFMLLRHLDYLLMLLIGITFFINTYFRKRILAEPDKKLIYLIGILQAIGMFYELGAIYAITSSVSGEMMILSVFLMGISFVLFSFFIATLFSMHTLFRSNALKIKSFLLVILSAACILIGVTHFIFD